MLRESAQNREPQAVPEEDLPEAATGEEQKTTETPEPSETAVVEQAGVEAADAVLRLEKELEDARDLADEYLRQLQRLQAEFDNYRRRMLKEQSRWSENAVSSFAGRILPVVDNLERALAAADPDSESTLKQGVEMILRMLLDALKAEGIETIESVGTPFDPAVHEAVLQEESTDHFDGQVMEELQKGYKSRSKILRPSLVKVARSPNKEGRDGDESTATTQGDRRENEHPEEEGEYHEQSSGN